MNTRITTYSIATFLLYSTQAFSQIQFTDISSQIGFPQSISGEGVCIFDFNNDGFDDFLVAVSNGSNLLYKNNGGMNFQEIGASAGIVTSSPCRMVTAADFDNDDDLDILLGVINGNSILLRNEGNETFTDVTSISGISNNGDVRGGSWCDFDGDTFIDFYVTNLSTGNSFYKNNGDGTFSEITNQVNAIGPVAPGAVMSSGFFDFDRDGDDDLLMTQDGNHGNVLLKMEQNGTFTDVSTSAGVDIAVQGMGVSFGDFDRDGYFDFYTTNLDENSLMKNNGDGTFSDVTIPSGSGGYPNNMAWGTFFFDADNDGWLDIYSNHETSFGQVPNTFYHNLQNGNFAYSSASAGLQIYNNGFGSGYSDFDNDGDLDIILVGKTSQFGSIFLLQNDSNTSNNWLQLTLEGTSINHFAVGSIVEVFTTDGTQTSFVAAGNGFASQNSLRLHFGLGTATSVDSVIVHWAGSDSENFGSLVTNQNHTLIQNTTVSVKENSTLPLDFKLSQNFPNPFNPSTLINYEFQITNYEFGKLVIFNVLGEKVREFELTENKGSVVWDGTNDLGQSVSSGNYFYELKVGNQTLRKKMTLLK